VDAGLGNQPVSPRHRPDGQWRRPGGDRGVLVALNVILGPLVEELYFRGYLLPRLHRFGIWAPLINISLFAAYHLWKPWTC